MPDRWSEELLSAGFSSPDAIVYDDIKPYHLSANIIASPASEAILPNRVTLLSHSESGPGVHETRACFEDFGIAVDICLFGQVPLHCQDIISLLDLQEPILHSISEEAFSTFTKYLLALDAAMLWVTQASQVNCKDPRAAMILGMARSVRNELSLDFFTIEVDSITPISMVAKAIFGIVRRIHSPERCDKEMDPDWEYAIVNSEIQVPRLHWEAMKHSIAQRPGESVSANKRITVGKTGLLHTMQWSEEDLEGPKDNEVIVKVKAVGLNFRVCFIKSFEVFAKIFRGCTYCYGCNG